MPIHDKSPRPQEFAAVDLGSNSFHMVIARVVDGAMQIIGRLKQRVHLADGLGPDNMLSEEAMTRGLNCLSLFAERLQGFSPASVCIVGTHTLRQALNATDFLKRAEKVIPYPIEIISQRIFWQIVFPATLFLILFQFAAFVGLLASRENLVGVMPFNLGTLINYQALLVGNLIGVPLCYFIIRVVRNPFYLRSYYSQLKQQVDAKVTKKEFALWLLALGALLLLLCMPLNEKSTIFSTNYTLSLLLPLMMWGAMRYGYKLISLLWAVVLMISIHSYQNYIPIYPGYTTQLTITSSSYLVFSFIVNYMAVLATRQRAVVRRIQRLAYVDPVVHLPNVRALNRALRDAPWSALCYLRIPGMEMLVKNYGIMLRIQYKQKLSHWLSPLLEPGEDVYQLSGNDLALRLNTESHQERITALDSHLKQFRFFWDGMPMQPQIGVSYCYVRSPVNHIYLLLGELNTVAELSIVTNAPENMQRRGAMYLQRELKDKVAMMNRLQQALEHNHFFLMAQPITGMRGDVYHEILLRMKGENDELISPDSFLPVAHEFGLSSSIDMWVIEHTLQFMAENRVKMPAHRFAINLSPTSVCQARFPVEVSQLLAKYQIEAWQLIFEVTASSLANQYHIDSEQARRVLDTTMQMYEQWREQQPKLAHPQLEALLRWAAMLHEVGLNINHSGLHRHSAYILQNSDLPGFNQEQQLMMATLVRYHRKAIKLDDLPRFTLFKKKQFLPLIQLLRLGVLLNNQRQATTTPPTLTLITDDSHWTLRFPHDWFSQNALVLLDLEKEQEYWEGVAGWRLKIEEESTPEIAA
jgi:GGDEF domain-containing protein